MTVHLSASSAVLRPHLVAFSLSGLHAIQMVAFLLLSFSGSVSGFLVLKFPLLASCEMHQLQADPWLCIQDAPSEALQHFSGQHTPSCEDIFGFPAPQVGLSVRKVCQCQATSRADAACRKTPCTLVASLTVPSVLPASISRPNRSSSVRFQTPGPIVVTKQFADSQQHSARGGRSLGGLGSGVSDSPAFEMSAVRLSNLCSGRPAI